ncbi:hypothetical protein HDR60_02060 [bacterium]|nr:hypothetical protein [bacterium]
MSDVKLSIVDEKENIPFISDYKNLDNIGFYPWTLAFKRNAMDTYKRIFNKKNISEPILNFITNNKFYLAKEKFVPALETLFKYKTFDMEAYTIVLVNGKYIPEISDEEDLPFSIYSDGINNCLIDNPDFLQNRVFIGNDLFVSLNSAYLHDGVVLKVSKSEKLSKPIHIISLHISDDKVLFSTPRIIIELEEGAKLDLLESSLSLSGAKYFENKVLQIDLKAGSTLNHYRYFSNSDDSLCIERDFVECGDRAKYNTYNCISKSGIMDMKYNFNILSNAELNSYTSVYSAGKNKVNFVADISHIASNSSSNVEFVGVANDNSNISFSTLLNTSALLDNIKTNQLSKILLLSENANGFIKPFQSIYSQNVSAFHGATVSGIKNDDLFFLNTRGINEDDAKNIIYKSYLLSAFSSIKNSLVLDEFIKFYWDD